eukprot:gene19276-21202_t
MTPEDVEKECDICSCEVFEFYVMSLLVSQGMGLLQVVSRVGAATAPWIAQWLKHYHASVPFAVMGSLTLIATILSLFLKETKGLATAEVLQRAAQELNEPMMSLDDIKTNVEEEPKTIDKVFTNVSKYSSERELIKA